MSTVEVTVTLSRSQAAAVLNAELSPGFGVRRSVDLVEAERRLHAAIGRALRNPDPAPRPMQTEPGA